MDDKNGCLNFIGLVAFIIGLYIWVNNVETVEGWSNSRHPKSLGCSLSQI